MRWVRQIPTLQRKKKLETKNTIDIEMIETKTAFHAHILWSSTRHHSMLPSMMEIIIEEHLHHFVHPTTTHHIVVHLVIHINKNIHPHLHIIMIIREIMIIHPITSLTIEALIMVSRGRMRGTRIQVDAEVASVRKKENAR